MYISNIRNKKTSVFEMPGCHPSQSSSEASLDPQHRNFNAMKHQKACTAQSVWQLGYGLANHGIKIQFLVEAKFSFPHNVQISSGAHPASYTMGSRDCLSIFMILPCSLVT
jgi:hypothetical protein